MKKFKSFYPIVLWSFIIFFVTFLYGIVINKNLMPSIFYINTSDFDISGLINTIWQVQAAVSLLSITLISLLIGKLDIRINGLLIRDTLMIKRYYQLGYWDKVITSIILLLGNMYYVSHNDLTGSSFIFFINALLIAWIYKDTFDVIMESGRYKDKVKRYIDNVIYNAIENENNDKIAETYEINTFIQNLTLHSEKLILEENRVQLNENIDCYLHLIKIIGDRSSKDFSKIEMLIQEKLVSITDSMLKRHLINEVKVLIEEITNNKKNYRNSGILIENLLKKLTDAVIVFESSREFYDNKIDSFILKISEVKNEEKCIIHPNEIAWSLAKYYINIKNNLYITNEDKSNLQIYFIDKITSFIFIKEDDIKYYILKRVIFHVSKIMIQENDINGFALIVSQLFINNRLGIKKKEIIRLYEIVGTLVIYLYYSCFKEDYFEETYKKRLEPYITAIINNGTKDRTNLMNLTKTSRGLFWYKYTIIKQEMSKFNWEYMPINSVKTLVIDNVIDEFFVFYSLAFIEKHDLRELKFDLSQTDARRILEYFNSEGSLKDECKPSYSEFCRWLQHSLENYTNKPFYKHLNMYYKQLVLDEIKNNREMLSIITANEEKIKSKILNKIKDSIFYKQSLDEKLCSKISIVPIPIDIGELVEKVIVFGPEIEDEVLEEFEEKIYKKLIEKCTYIQFEYEETDKIIKILNKLDELSKKYKISINGLINRKLSEDWSITYNEEKQHVLKLQNYEESVTYLGKLYRELNAIYIDKSKVHIGISISSINIRDLTDDEVDKNISELKQEEELYIVNTVNNVDIQLNKEEAKFYFKQKSRVLEVECYIYTNIKEQAGVIIDIR